MAAFPCLALVSYIQQLKWPPTGHLCIWADILGGRQETEIYMAGSICYWGYNGHHSSHSWVNKLGKMILLQAQNDPNNAAEWIFVCACIIAGWPCVCVCVWTEGAGKHTYKQATSLVSESSWHKDIMTQRGRLQSLFFLTQQRLMAAFRISTHH